jgi:hypothetical protein
VEAWGGKKRERGRRKREGGMDGKEGRNMPSMTRCSKCVNFWRHCCEKRCEYDWQSLNFFRPVNFCKNCSEMKQIWENRCTHETSEIYLRNLLVQPRVRV